MSTVPVIKFKDVEEYISSQTGLKRTRLEKIRMTIKKAVPEAKEVISYQMPAFKFNGMLVWFAAHSNHIGFYPGASGIEAFKEELSIYKGAKGSVQFPLDKPLPLGLITKIAKFRATENLQKVKTKKK